MIRDQLSAFMTISFTLRMTMKQHPVMVPHVNALRKAPIVALSKSTNIHSAEQQTSLHSFTLTAPMIE